MTPDNQQFRNNFSQDLTDVLIRLGLIAFLAYASVKVFSPFLALMLWALILAVTLYPLHQMMANKLGGKQGRAATLLILIATLLLGLPTVMMGGSAADFAVELHTSIQNGTLSVTPPSASVAEWPIVGEKLYALWSLAATDMPALLENLRPYMTDASKAGLSFVTGAAASIFQIIFALIIAGIMMAYGKSGSETMLKIICRFSNPTKGLELHKLSTDTIRSVSMGVIGVALIQAIAVGSGFFWADIPAAGLLAIIVLVLGIAQIPGTVISLPVIAYIWWRGGTDTENIMYSVYIIVAGLVDAPLKPILLGRGVDAPMPVILLGALGGMIVAGIIGLFLGAVMLALAYVIFMDWVNTGSNSVNDTTLTDQNNE